MIAERGDVGGCARPPLIWLLAVNRWSTQVEPGGASRPGLGAVPAARRGLGPPEGVQIAPSRPLAGAARRGRSARWSAVPPPRPTACGRPHTVRGGTPSTAGAQRALRSAAFPLAPATWPRCWLADAHGWRPGADSAAERCDNARRSRTGPGKVPPPAVSDRGPRTGTPRPTRRWAWLGGGARGVSLDPRRARQKPGWAPPRSLKPLGHTGCQNRGRGNRGPLPRPPCTAGRRRRQRGLCNGLPLPLIAGGQATHPERTIVTVTSTVAGWAVAPGGGMTGST